MLSSEASDDAAPVVRQAAYPKWKKIARAHQHAAWQVTDPATPARPTARR